MATKIGITGHQSLEKRLKARGAQHSEADAWEWVESAFAGALPSDAVVISSLAIGADQRLSRLALEHGARLQVVIPSAKYIETFGRAVDRGEYERLLSQAIEVVRLDYPDPSEEAFFAAGKYVVHGSDSIVAVWDGQEAEGLGGTSDIVAYGQKLGRPMLLLDPIRRTASRSGAETRA